MKYNVYVTRDTSESALITVEADSEDEAEDKAWAAILDHSTPLCYEGDDVAGLPYISDVQEALDD